MSSPATPAAPRRSPRPLWSWPFTVHSRKGGSFAAAPTSADGEQCGCAPTPAQPAVPLAQRLLVAFLYRCIALGVIINVLAWITLFFQWEGRR